MTDEYVDEESVKKLIAAVLIQMIRDWKNLEYGKYKSAPIPGGKVDREEIIQFVKSGDFDAFLSYVTPIPPKEARKALKLEKIATEPQPLTNGEIDALRAMAANNMNVFQAALALRISRKGMYGRLRSIEIKTGVNPREFWGLRKLLLENTEEAPTWITKTD